MPEREGGDPQVLLEVGVQGGGVHGTSERMMRQAGPEVQMAGPTQEVTSPSPRVVLPMVHAPLARVCCPRRPLPCAACASTPGRAERIGTRPDGGSIMLSANNDKAWESAKELMSSHCDGKYRVRGPGPGDLRRGGAGLPRRRPAPWPIRSVRPERRTASALTTSAREARGRCSPAPPGVLARAPQQVPQTQTPPVPRARLEALPGEGPDGRRATPRRRRPRSRPR